MVSKVDQKLQALIEFGQVIAAGIRLHEDEILEFIHYKSSRLINTDNMYIALYDEATDTVRLGLVLVDGERVDVEKKEGYRRRRRGKGKTDEIIRTRQPIFHPTKAEAEAWYAQPGHEKYVGAVLPSWMGVPMIMGNEVLGVIATYHPTQENVYSTDDLEILQAVANMAAIALDNTRMFCFNWRLLTTLVEFGQVITSGIRLREDEILELIHRQASSLMDTDNLYIALYDETTDTVWFGLAFLGGKRVDVATEEGWQPRRAGQGRTEWIIHHRKPLFIATRADSKAWYEQPGRIEYIAQPFASWLGVPMMVGDKVLGVIATYHPTREYVYNSDDLEILQAMANQAAIALDNARLYDINRRLESLAEVGQVLTSSMLLSEDEILELIYWQASRVMDTDNMYIALYDEATNTVRFRLASVDGRRVDVEKEPGWRQLLAGRDRTGEIIHTRKPFLHATRVEAEEWYAQPGHEEYIGDVLSSWMGVPMMVGEKVLGIIATYHPTREYVYNSDDLEILQVMANQAAIALENARLHQHLMNTLRLEGG